VRVVAQGISVPDILAEYPRLQPDDIRAALLYAATENNVRIRPTHFLWTRYHSLPSTWRIHDTPAPRPVKRSIPVARNYGMIATFAT